MISQSQSQHRLRKFSVTVGHASVTVEGMTHDEAIERARRQLCLELPRMWDVIQSMDDSRFLVAVLN